MKPFLIALFTLFSTVLFAKQEIKTIPLNHRVASQILPEIQAFLPPNATARAYNELIIIKAESADIRQLKQLINQLDTPMQRVRISVLKTDELLENQQGSQISATADINKEAIDGEIAIKRWSTNKSRNKEHSYQAQGIVGKPILIMTGQDVPQQEQFLYFNPNGGIAVQSNTRYISLNNGFQAVARLLPSKHVTVEIHPSFAQMNARGTINKSTIISTISGPVGTWIPLGQVDNEKNLEKHGSTRYHTHRQQQQTIYIKVDQL